MKPKKILQKIIIFLLISLLIGVAIFVLWANSIYQADPEKLSSVRTNSSFIITEKPGYFQISPSNCDAGCERGLIFYPGAKVDPKAYFYKLSGLATKEYGKVKIFITKPTLNLAFFGVNQGNDIINDQPEIKSWSIGGHSLGGAMSCEFLKNNPQQVKKLILIGSYCASDLSKFNIDVLTIHGDLDKVLSNEKLTENAKNLPQSTIDIPLKGMNHAQAGNYGEQEGDQKATLDDDAVKQQILSQFKGVL